MRIRLTGPARTRAALANNAAVIVPMIQTPVLAAVKAGGSCAAAQNSTKPASDRPGLYQMLRPSLPGLLLAL